MARRWESLPSEAMHRPGAGIGTQETREITEWNPQIQLPVCLHGYDNPHSEALPGRSDATRTHTRIGYLRCPDGRVWRQQRCLVFSFQWFFHRKELDIGIPVLPRQAWRHVAEGRSWWGTSFGRLQRDSPVRRGSSRRRWWESSVWSRWLRGQLQFPEGHPGVREPPTQGCRRRKR